MKKKILRVVLGLAVVLCGCVFCGQNTYANKTANIPDYEGHFIMAERMWVVHSAFSVCAFKEPWFGLNKSGDYVVQRNTYFGANMDINASDARSGKISGDKVMVVGPYEESLIEHQADDGKISCLHHVSNLASDLSIGGIKWDTDLMCNKDNQFHKAGVLVPSINMGIDESAECGSGKADNYAVLFNGGIDDSYGFYKKVVTDKIKNSVNLKGSGENNNYVLSASSVAEYANTTLSDVPGEPSTDISEGNDSNIRIARRYFYYLQEFESYCGKRKDDGTAFTMNNFVYVPKGGEKDGWGKKIVQKFEPKESTRDLNSATTFYDGERHTCANIINWMDANADTVRGVIKSELNKSCGDAYKNSLTEEERQAVTLSSDPDFQYIKGDATNGYTCVDGINAIAGEDEIPEGQEDECYSSAGSLGWVLCPIISATTGLMNWLYGLVEENFLKVPAVSIFGKKDNASNIQGAWGVFRTLANVVVVILLLVVIFSQLTGIGIDNYGIKKILPKLLITVLLINLSRVLCALAVDLSNIIGNSLEGFLMNSFQVENAAVEPKDTLGFSYFLTFGAAGIALGGVALATIFVGPGMLIGILALLVSGVVAMLTLLLILVIRQAGIVLLTVVAPVAIACYLLPGTESVFKRWFGAMKALLILYPICSLVVGAGKLAGKILADLALNMNYRTSDSGNVMGLAAMLIQVIPFFFIPAIAKKSLAAIGSIGAKIAGLGANAGRRAKGKMSDSGIAQGARRSSQRRRAGYKKDGTESKNKIYRARKWLAGTKVGRAIGTNTRLARDSKEARANMNEGTEAEIENMRFDTNNHDVATMARMLRTGRDKDGKKEISDVRKQALVQQLSSTKEGKRELANLAVGRDVSADTISVMAKSGAASAIADVDDYGAAYLNSVNRNGYEESYAEWSRPENTQPITNRMDSADLVKKMQNAVRTAFEDMKPEQLKAFAETKAYKGASQDVKEIYEAVLKANTTSGTTGNNGSTNGGNRTNGGGGTSSSGGGGTIDY